MPDSEPERGPIAAALRRSWLTIVVCVVAGLAIMAVIHAARAQQYTASSDVYIAEQDLNSLVLGVAVTTDPSRDISNDLQLASSINYQQAVARALGQPGFGYKQVESNMSVTNDGTDDILKFTASGDNRQLAVKLANTAVRTYSSYRASILSQPILVALSSGGGTVSDTKRLNLLRRLNRTAVVISQAQTAEPTSTLRSDLGVGLVAGLVVGLLLMALRQAVPRLSPGGGSAPLRRSEMTEVAPPTAHPASGDGRGGTGASTQSAAHSRTRNTKGSRARRPKPSAPTPPAIDKPSPAPPAIDKPSPSAPPATDDE